MLPGVIGLWTMALLTSIIGLLQPVLAAGRRMERARPATAATRAAEPSSKQE